MPKSGTPVLEIPKFIQGQFLNVHFSEQSLKTQIHRISRRGSDHIEILTKDATYLDSISLETLGLNKIDTAYFDGRKLIVLQEGIERQLNLGDSLKSGLEEISLVLDLGENLFALDDTVRSELIFANGVYYLNIDSDSINYKSIIAFENEDNSISFWTSLVLEQGSEERINMLSKNLEIMKKRIDQGKFYSVDYYAQLTDEEFFDIIHDEELFLRQVFYKIEPKETNWSLWPLLAAILFIFGVVLVIKKKKTKAHHSV